MNDDEKEYAWSVRLGHTFKETLKPFTMPRIRQTFEFLPLSIRYLKYHRDCRKQNIQAHMDFFRPIPVKQIYGAPIGGIGTGSIGRSFSGDFCRFALVPGLYEHGLAEANLFTVCIRKKGKTVYQQVLSVRRSKLSGLRAWNMGFSGDQATYHAIYPESWTVYNLPGQNVRLTCHQLSPVIPHDYKNSSLPVGLFEWTVENNNDEEVEVSIMFSWQAGSATDEFALADVISGPFEHYAAYDTAVSGVVINQTINKMPLQYCIGARCTDKCDVTYRCQFDPTNCESGTSVWMDMLHDGRLDNTQFTSSPSGTERLASAVCAKVTVGAASTEQIDFSLVWNMPIISFSTCKLGDKPAERITYRRFYTRYFPDTDPNCAKNIACYSLVNGSGWQESLRAWRHPILTDPALPSWYKRALFNELYFISDGGTVWLDIKDDPNMKHQLVKDYGRFAYLEGHEYRMYNTYDVHFNASYALLQLFPKLQLSLQYEFADTIPKESANSITFLYDGKYSKQKSKNSLPHDIGDPHGEPWLDLNVYNSHDTRDWKDLNLKFILSVYRDFHHLQDREYLDYMWPYIKDLMVTVQSQDHDNDGLIDSTGWPDQTYDAWAVTGASAYCGGLHVATLKVVCDIAKLMGEQDTFEKYNAILSQAKSSYDSKLWNGKYYNYDCSNKDYKDSVMSDMCCGHWYLRSSGFEYEAFEKEKIHSCLNTIFDLNVMKFADGKGGAVNGMRPNGKVDMTSMQSEEMWIGTTACLASLYVFEGMSEKAWTIVEGLYSLLYDRLGLAFQTPEALFETNTFRSLGYMRPLAIWSIQYALDKKRNKANQ